LLHTHTPAIRDIDLYVPSPQAKTVSVIPLEENEAAFSLAIVPFSARAGELHLVVGTAANTILTPRSCSSGFLRTYTFTEDGTLEFQHKVCTVIDTRHKLEQS
jgi:splicing factor 3B subunit 3